MTRLDTFLTRCLDVLAALRAQLGRKFLFCAGAVTALIAGFFLAADKYDAFVAGVGAITATFCASNAAISRVAAANKTEDPDARP